MSQFRPRVLSGMQPTGNLHLGNYLGAMLNWIKMQETHETLYCVVDLHAITQGVSVWGGTQVLHKAILDVTAAYIACGLDPRKSILFNQSQVAEHAETAVGGGEVQDVTRTGGRRLGTVPPPRSGGDELDTLAARVAQAVGQCTLDIAGNAPHSGIGKVAQCCAAGRVYIGIHRLAQEHCHSASSIRSMIYTKP